MRLFNRKKNDDGKVLHKNFDAYPHLMAIKPKEAYVFRSDYFEVDNYVATIMNFFHHKGSADNFAPFWGINKIPSGLPAGVTTVNFEQVSRMGESWISSRQTKSESVSEANYSSQVQAGTNTTRSIAKRSTEDLQIIAEELNDGASYLYVQSRILVKAPDLQSLEDATSKLSRLYLDRFGTLWTAPYQGEQRRELTDLTRPNHLKYGKGFYYTSTEYAGSYSLVTHGLEDPKGEYVGQMMGDVNNSAVIFDANGFDHHVVVSSEQHNQARGRARISDMWGSKIAQTAMLNNHRVIHILMDDVDMSKIGPEFKSITSIVDMNQGDVNMFEMFGKKDDELSVYAAHMQKLILMAEQAYETTESDRSVIRGSLEEIATKFYVDHGMWNYNAMENRDKLRVVGIPHDEVPMLHQFVTYLDMEYKAMTAKTARDDERLHALSVLSVTFRNLLSSNGDLFNTITSDAIDDAVKNKRVIYDFSSLLQRGKGVAMAQLVNVIGFAIGNLGLGDVVVIHGAENIDPGIRHYVNTQLEFLYRKGGRVAYLYSNNDKMLDDQSFNNFDKADYTIFGNMTNNVVKRYQTSLGQKLSPDLANLITDRSSSLCYIRRGFDNVVFHQNLQLDPFEENTQSRFTRRRMMEGAAS